MGSYDEMINSGRIDCQHAETLARGREGALGHFVVYIQSEVRFGQDGGMG